MSQHRCNNTCLFGRDQEEGLSTIFLVFHWCDVLTDLWSIWKNVLSYISQLKRLTLKYNPLICTNIAFLYHFVSTYKLGFKPQICILTNSWIFGHLRSPFSPFCLSSSRRAPKGSWDMWGREGWNDRRGAWRASSRKQEKHLKEHARGVVTELRPWTGIQPKGGTLKVKVFSQTPFSEDGAEGEQLQSEAGEC